MTEEELKAKINQMEADALVYAQKQIPLWVKIALALVLVALLIAGAAAGYYYLKHEHAVVLNQQQITQSAELAKALSISGGQAKKLTAELAAANQREPNVTYVVQAPTVEQAAVQVKKDIDAGKSPANQIPADKTVVTPNKAEQKVDVYRIQMDKAKWGVSVLVLAGGGLPVEVGGGLSYTNKDWGADGGYTSKDRAYLMTRFYPKFLN